jgi:hypothetical protein
MAKKRNRFGHGAKAGRKRKLKKTKTKETSERLAAHSPSSGFARFTVIRGLNSSNFRISCLKTGN